MWWLLGAKQRSSCGYLKLEQVIFAGRSTASLRKVYFMFYQLSLNQSGYTSKFTVRYVTWSQELWCRRSISHHRHRPRFKTCSASPSSTEANRRVHSNEVLHISSQNIVWPANIVDNCAMDMMRKESQIWTLPMSERKAFNVFQAVIHCTVRRIISNSLNSTYRLVQNSTTLWLHSQFTWKSRFFKKKKDMHW